MPGDSLPIRRVVAGVLAVLVVAAGASGVAAVSVGSFTADPIRLSMADTTDLNDVHVERRTLNQSGGDIVGVTTAINNTQLTDLSVDVIVQLERLDGSVVERETTTVLLGAVSVTVVELSLSQSQAPADFAAVNVTVVSSL